MHLPTIAHLLLLLLSTLPNESSAQGPPGTCLRIQKPRYATLPPVPFPAPANKTLIQTLSCPNGMKVTFEGDPETNGKKGAKGKGVLTFDGTGLEQGKYGMVGRVEFEVKSDAQLKWENVKKGPTEISSFVYNGNSCEAKVAHVKRVKSLTCYKRMNTGKEVHEVY